MTPKLSTLDRDILYFPVVQEEISWSLERKGTPGKLTFQVVDDGKLVLQEGNQVCLTVDEIPVFYGYVFSIKRGKEPTVDVTAYDQLRYLKNKDSIVYQDRKASELVRMLAADYFLSVGTIEDTGYVIESGVEENQTLLDIIESALEETTAHTGELYVLFDDFGKLSLRNIKSLSTDLLIDEQTGESFDYTSTIDEGTANRIKLLYEDSQAGTRQFFVAQDAPHMEEWGILQYFEKVNSAAGAQAKAETLLSQYNQKTRKLSFKGVLGNLSVRAGSRIMVSLSLGQLKLQRFMLVERVTHHFKENQHQMDLDLIGGEFVV